MVFVSAFSAFRYDVASERQKVHCQFAVTADFMTVWRKLSLNTRAGLRKRARKEGPSPAKGTLVPKPSAIRTGPSAPAADARLPSDEETAPASFAPSSGKQQNGTTAATAGDSPGGAALAAPAVAAAATKTVSNDAVPTEAKEQAAGVVAIASWLHAQFSFLRSKCALQVLVKCKVVRL